MIRESKLTDIQKGHLILNNLRMQQSDQTIDTKIIKTTGFLGSLQNVAIHFSSTKIQSYEDQILYLNQIYGEEPSIKELRE